MATTPGRPHILIAPSEAIDDGARAVEVGSHDELMARGGRYAELYRIQARAYQ